MDAAVVPSAKSFQLPAEYDDERLRTPNRCSSPKLRLNDTVMIVTKKEMEWVARSMASLEDAAIAREDTGGPVWVAGLITLDPFPERNPRTSVTSSLSRHAQSRRATVFILENDQLVWLNCKYWHSDVSLSI